jgi:hypothetical protein
VNSLLAAAERLLAAAEAEVRGPWGWPARVVA